MDYMKPLTSEADFWRSMSICLVLSAATGKGLAHGLILGVAAWLINIGLLWFWRCNRARVSRVFLRVGRRLES